MSKQENFNDILRSKFTERETPVNEEDWRKMRKTIDDSRSRKRRILWVAGSILGLLFGFGMYEYTTTKNTSETVASLDSKAIPPTVTTTNDIKNSNSNTARKITQATKEEKESIKETTHTNTAETASVASDKTISPQSIAAVNQKKESSLKIPSVSSNITYTASVKPWKQLPAKHSMASGAESSEVVQLNKIPSSGSKTNMDAVANAYVPAKNKETSSANQTGSAQVANASMTESFVSANKKPDSTKNQTVSETVNNTTVNPQSSQVKIKSDSVAKNQIVAEETKNAVAPSKSNSTNKKVDSIPASKAVSDMASPPLPPIEDKVASKNSFSIEAGAGYSLGWSYSDTVQGRGLNPTIGIGYTRTLSPKFALKTGIQLSSLSGMGTSPFIIKHVNYDFGYNSNDTSLKTQWLFYLTVPLQVEYKLDEKDAIGLGGTLSYLLTGYGQLSTSSVAGDVSRTTNAYSQFMYVKGFNQWNASVFLLYKRTLFGKLSAYIIPYFGLMDIKSNSFFSQNKFERDSGLKLLLSYTIL